MSELEDREEIRQLIATYTIHGDRGRLEALAGVFAQDGVLETSGWRAEGRAGIIEALSPRADAPAREAAPGTRGPIVRHHLTTCLIEFQGPDEATGRTYWINYSEKGADHSGLYADHYRRIEGRWQIAHRDVRLDWIAPDSWAGPENFAGPRPPDAPPLRVFRGA